MGNQTLLVLTTCAIVKVRVLDSAGQVYSSIAVFFNKLIYFIYLFLAALGLCCCARAFSSCGTWAYCSGFSCCRAWALRARASVVAACGLSSYGSWALERRLGSYGAQALLLHGMWDLPGPGLEPVSPALAGGFLTTAPPGKSRVFWFWFCFYTLF